MAITLKKTSGYYDAQQIIDLFEEYNLILHTNIGTIDTTLFNIAKKTSGIGLDATVVQATNGDSIDFAYNPKATSSDVPAISNNELKPYESSAVRIPVRIIQKVTIKSKRNFLLNQTIAKKK